MWVQSLGWEDSPGEGHGSPLQYFCAESHGQRSLVGYSPWGRKELDTTEVTEHARTLEYLLLDPVGVFESPYRIHLRMSHAGVRSGGSIFHELLSLNGQGWP